MASEKCWFETFLNNLDKAKKSVLNHYSPGKYSFRVEIADRQISHGDCFWGWRKARVAEVGNAAFILVVSSPTSQQINAIFENTGLV